jgi:hypothetical protein
MEPLAPDYAFTHYQHDPELSTTSLPVAATTAPSVKAVQ